jgi:hypothetical protein
MANTIFEQKPQNIRTFKPGTVVTRINKAIINTPISENMFDDEGSLMITKPKIGDGSWIGEPMKFIGIANGCVIMQFMSTYRKNELHNLECINGWEEGWAEYIDPKSLLELIENKS